MIWVVGESPGPTTRSSDRLARLVGVEPDAFRHAVLWLNLWPGPGSDPDLMANMIRHSAGDRDVILLLGRRVARVFGLDHLGALGTAQRGLGPRVQLMPHPSWRNRWWNDPDHVEEAMMILKGKVWPARF